MGSKSSARRPKYRVLIVARATADNGQAILGAKPPATWAQAIAYARQFNRAAGAEPVPVGLTAIVERMLE